MKRSILMIDDEQALVMAVGDRLESEGYRFDFSLDGDAGLLKAEAGAYDALILDIMLPGRSGYDIVRTLRHNGSELPILLLSAKSQVIDRVSGLRSGADDYLVKPFDFEELLARLEVILRKRAAVKPADPPKPDPEETERLDLERPEFLFGPFILNFRKAALYRLPDREPNTGTAGNGAPEPRQVPLSYQEFRLLCFLATNRGGVVDNETLLNRVWGYDADVTSRTLYVHVSWLRKKLACPGHPDGFIRTVRRIGYLFTG